MLSCCLSKVPVPAHAVLRYRRVESLVLRQQITVFVLAATPARKDVLESGGYTGPVRFQGPSRSDWRSSVFAPHRRRPAQSDNAAPHPPEPRLHLPLLLTGEARKDPGGRAPESNGGVGTALSHAFRIRGLPRRVGVNTQGHVCTWRRVPKKKRKAKQALLCALQACKPRAGRQAGRLDRQVGMRRSARASQCSAVRRRCATRGDQRMRRMACVETGGDQTRPDESSRVESSRGRRDHLATDRCIA
jgi:hypothetical protein